MDGESDSNSLQKPWAVWAGGKGTCGEEFEDAVGNDLKHFITTGIGTEMALRWNGE